MNWYLKTIEKDIETEEELTEKKIILDKVLDRLITHVSWNNQRWFPLSNRAIKAKIKIPKKTLVAC